MGCWQGREIIMTRSDSTAIDEHLFGAELARRRAEAA